MKFLEKKQRNVSTWISTHNAPFLILSIPIANLTDVMELRTQNAVLHRLANAKQWNVETMCLRNVNLMTWGIECATIQSKGDASILHWIIHWNDIDMFSTKLPIISMLLNAFAM